MKSYVGEIFECVVIDGSNVITKSVPTTKGLRRSFDVERLVKTIETVHGLGWPTMVGMKMKTFRHGVSSKKGRFGDLEREIMEDLINKDVVSMIDDDNDDEWIIRAAIDRNGWILSNDRFRKEVETLVKDGEYRNANEINKRMCKIEFVGSEPIFVLPKNHELLGKTVVERIRESRSSFEQISSVEVSVLGNDGITGLRIPLGIPIGRSNFIGVADDKSISSVSRSHFIIDSRGGEILINDLGSTNGTILNGMHLAPGFYSEIADGSEVKIGKVEFRF